MVFTTEAKLCIASPSTLMSCTGSLESMEKQVMPMAYVSRRNNVRLNTLRVWVHRDSHGNGSALPNRPFTTAIRVFSTATA